MLKKIKRDNIKKFFINDIIFTSFYLFFTTIKDFFIKSRINISQKISHFGFSLFILSIILNGIFSNEIITNIQVGEKYEFKRGSIYFEKIENFKKQNFMSVIGTFKIKEEGNYIDGKENGRWTYYLEDGAIETSYDIKGNFLSRINIDE